MKVKAMRKYSYNWNLADVKFDGSKGRVFSCFSGGGGSSLGYKLAGFDVVGCNEIDSDMMRVYIDNHSPKYPYLEPIQTFKDRQDLPAELLDLDILDGSPPCSSFSLNGKRHQTWGKEKVFREGQAAQVLDTLFFDFIDLAKRLQPKVVIAENVKGIIMGKAISYAREIYRAFDAAGYYCQHWLLDASKMGVPQRRERVFFVALRKDLAGPFMESVDMFSVAPKLDLAFDQPQIPYSAIAERGGTAYAPTPGALELLEKCKAGQCCADHHPKRHFFSYHRVDESAPLLTITAGLWRRKGGAVILDNGIWRGLTPREVLLASSFPLDYKLGRPEDAYYICGMSVPPLMIANIADRVHAQWLTPIKALKG